VSSATTVTVNDISSYNCPSQVDKSNWLSTDTFSDAFGISINGDSVTATRTDDAGAGWSMSLSFKCCKGMFLIFNFALLKYNYFGLL
jgi:hypothetical protein